MSTRAIRNVLERAERVCTAQELSDAIAEVDAMEKAARAISTQNEVHVADEDGAERVTDAYELLERIAKEAGK